MKKILCMILAFCMVLSLCACGGTPEEPSEGMDEPEEGESQDAGTDDSGQSIEVDSGLLNVTITVPADFVGETTQETLDAELDESGMKSATLNGDGSVTYVMSKSKHNELMQTIKDSIDDSLSEMVGSEEYPNFTTIDANDDYTKFKITTKSETLGLDESFSVLAFYLYGGMYHAFNGTDVDNINVQFVNADTGEVIEESNSKDMG